MKNFLFRAKPAASSIAAILFGLFIFAPVMASPSGTPPSSNVNANFNSVTTGVINNPTGNTSGVNINSANGLFVMDPTNGTGFEVLPTGDFYSITNNTTATKLGNVNSTVTNVSANQLTAPFYVKNGGQNVFSVDQNGNIQNPSGNLTFNKGLISTSNGTAVSGTATGASGYGVSGMANVSGGTGGYFSGNSYGISATSSGGTAGHFSNLSNSVDLASTTNSIVANGPSNFTGNMAVTGNLTVSQGIGRIYSASGSGTSIPANTYAFAGTAFCSSGNHRAVSCSFSAANNVVLADSTVAASSCTIYVKNTAAVAVTVTPKVTCFDPSGTPW